VRVSELESKCLCDGFTFSPAKSDLWTACSTKFMDASDVSNRRRTVEMPTKPESGLAEWTSKIKAMQRLVDEDEEAETRRLEQEIAASRLARMRRSTGRGTSVDLGMFLHIVH
jgi:hypothetical protein